MVKKSKDDLGEGDTFGKAIDDIDNELEQSIAAAKAAEAAPVDDLSGELTDAEKKEIEAQARTEVAASIKNSKMKAYKAQVKKQLLAQQMFSEGKDDKGNNTVDVDLYLASYPKWIMLDGKRYHHGRRYRVKAGVASVLMEQMSRGWEQEEARRGEKVELLPATQKILGKNGLKEVPIYH